MSFNTKIRELRIAQGLTQKQLAQKAKISRAYLAQLELHKRQPSVITLINLSRALNLIMSDLIC